MTGKMNRKKINIIFAVALIIILLIVYSTVVSFSDKKAVGETNDPDYSVKFIGPDAKVYDNRGREVISLNNIAFFPGRSSPVMLNHKLYWVTSAKRGEKKSSQWIELRVTDLKTKETRGIFADQWIEFQFNHKKNAIAVSHESYDKQKNQGRAAVLIIDLPDRVQKDIIQDVKEYAWPNYSILGWSSDDSALWITYTFPSGVWDDLIVYKNKEVIHVHEVHGGDDTIVDFDFGWVVYSDYPEMFDDYSVKDYKESGKTNTLWLYDVFRKKRVKVATNIARRFGPTWETPSQNTRKFVYSIGDKQYTADPLALLNSADTSTIRPSK